MKVFDTFIVFICAPGLFIIYMCIWFDVHYSLKVWGQNKMKAYIQQELFEWHE